MKKPLAAFSLVEMLILVIFVGALAMISVPRINLGIIDKKKADTASRKLLTDLRRARRLAISDAAVNADGYALTLKGSGPYKGYDIVNRKTSQVVDSHAFDPGIVCTADGKTYSFHPNGSLTSSGSKIRLTSRGKTFALTLVPATGMVKCTEE